MKRGDKNTVRKIKNVRIIKTILVGVEKKNLNKSNGLGGSGGDPKPGSQANMFRGKRNKSVKTVKTIFQTFLSILVKPFENFIFIISVRVNREKLTNSLLPTFLDLHKIQLIVHSVN